MLATHPQQDAHRTILQRIAAVTRVFDTRFEDLDRTTWKRTTYRDFSAGLIVALTAIPMAMGFAMASGLRPEQGIVAGALACVVGRTFGGSKYQVYGPTAAFIPVIASVMAKYGEQNGGSFERAHGMLVFVSILAGVVLVACGILGLGKIAKKVPSSIVVGFTIGIAVAIALSNAGDAFGLRAPLAGGLIAKVKGLVAHASEINGWALLLAGLTFAATRLLLRVSIFIPAPLLALGACTALSSTVLADKGITLVRDRYGSIPTNFFVFTPPIVPSWSAGVALDVLYFVAAIVFVSGVESLLCSSMADRLAQNRRTPFDADKEFFGQGLVQIITPLVNGFPCTGALARTATSIKAGARTPLAGYFKAVLKLSLAYFVAPVLERVPLACVGGILLWVASNMIKKQEIREVLQTSRFHTALMIYTAVMVPLTDFMTGVLSALILYIVGRFVSSRFRAQPEPTAEPAPSAEPAPAVVGEARPAAE